MPVLCRCAHQTFVQAGRAKHDPGIAGIPIVESLLDLLNASVVDLDPRDVVEIKDAIFVAVHGEVHFSGCGQIVGQGTGDPGIEKMIDHHQEERSRAGATPGRQSAGAVALFPALGFDKVDRDAATSSDI